MGNEKYKKTKIGKTQKAIWAMRKFRSGQLENIKDKDNNVFHPKEDEIFVPAYDKKYAKGGKEEKAIGASRANSRKYISNYGNIVSFTNNTPKWIHGESVNKERGKTSYNGYGDSEYIHRTEWFSFALNELVTKERGEVLKSSDKYIYDIRTLNKVFDEKIKIKVKGKNGEETEKEVRRFEIHHKNSNSKDNRIENLQCLDYYVHDALEGLYFESFNKADKELEEKLKESEKKFWKNKYALLKNANPEKPIIYMEKDGRREVVPINEQTKENPFPYIEKDGYAITLFPIRANLPQNIKWEEVINFLISVCELNNLQVKSSTAIPVGGLGTFIITRNG